MTHALLPLILSACTGGKDVDDTAPDESTPADDSATGDSPPADDTSPPADETGADSETQPPPPPVPPRVILFIGDGMGRLHVEGGGEYQNGEAGTLAFEGMPYAGRLVTASPSGITDSAAGATSMSTGVKTWNDVVGEDKTYASVENVLELARSRGLATGVVTTDALTGATPASFYAHVDNRFSYSDITTQLLADPPDVALGGGLSLGKNTIDPAVFQQLTTRDELLAAAWDGRSILGTFSSGSFPYLGEGYGEQPSLAEMTAFALDVLDDDPDGFFLMVEGARIDHASHGNLTDYVYLETAALGDAVGEAMEWAATQETEPTILVTADHECGGLEIVSSGEAGEIPETEWRWGRHTNADVNIYGMGPLAETFDGQRLPNQWVHAVLEAAVYGLDTPETPPDEIIPDGRLDDFTTSPVTTQAWTTDFGEGFNQLDAMTVESDTYALHIGIDGVFDRSANTVVVLFDMDYGAGTGFGADDTTLADTDGASETALTNMPYTSGIDGMGFDIAWVATMGQELELGDMDDLVGLRGLADPWVNDPTDLWWLTGVSNYDDGNVAIDSVAAPDAGAAGETENGYEIQVPWLVFYPEGMPADGLSIAVAAVICNTDCTIASNQALPPFDDSTPSEGSIPITSVVRLDVDSSGAQVGAARLGP